MSITNNPNKEFIQKNAEQRLTMVSNLDTAEAKLEVKEFIQDAIKKTMEDPAKKTTASDVLDRLDSKTHYIYFNQRESKYYICNLKQINRNEELMDRSLKELKKTLENKLESSKESLEKNKIKFFITTEIKIIEKHLDKIKKYARSPSTYDYLIKRNNTDDVDVLAFDELIAFNIQFEIKFILDGDMNDWRIPKDDEKTLIFNCILNKHRGRGSPSPLFVCKDLCELYDATEYFKEDAEFVGKVYKYKDESKLDSMKLPDLEKEGNRGGKNRKTHRRNSKNRRNNTRRNQKPKKQYKKK